MIIKSLLFIIVCIFVYETFQNFSKMNEEYFANNTHNANNTNNTNEKYNEKFITISNDPEKNQIAKIISKNCKAYPTTVNQIMVYKPESGEELDTPYYAQLKPLEYDPKRKYYWQRDILVPEGIRRSQDDDKEIARVQALLDNETDPDKKKILEDEMSLFKWRKNILSTNDETTGLPRNEINITTDYFPAEIGMVRPWIEIHSHIPDYSY